MTWVRVASADQIPEGRGIVVNRDPVAVAVFRFQGAFYALENTCPHQGGPLGLGRIDGEYVVCPLHEWRFHVRTGQTPGLILPGVKIYRTEARADGVYVEMPD